MLRGGATMLLDDLHQKHFRVLDLCSSASPSLTVARNGGDKARGRREAVKSLLSMN
jgi:hypothetical protein